VGKLIAEILYYISNNMSQSNTKVNRDDPVWCESQWKKYMSDVCDWSLDDAYKRYIRPGHGGKRWTAEEKKVFDLIPLRGRHTHQNPYVFRFLD
jgi:hypothetical protein